MSPKPNTYSFTELSDRPENCILGLDNYQRGFVWGQRRVRQLVADLASFIQDLNRGDIAPEHAYYMGTVILHRVGDPSRVGEGSPDNAVTHYVIDGQQRLAALALLWAALSTDFSARIPAGIRFRYRTPDSQKRLQCAYRAIVHESGKQLKYDNESIGELFSNIVVTTVTTSSEDDAFAFFDSQNTRGVPLDTTDLLKAHHLRAVRFYSRDTENAVVNDIERNCAQRWEKLQQEGRNSRPAQDRSDYASRLFSRYLWRGRHWTGGNRSKGHRQALLSEFRDKAYPPHDLINEIARNSNGLSSSNLVQSANGGVGQVACFPSAARVLRSTLCWSGRGRVWEVNLCLPPQSANPKGFPFSLRQPLSAGAGFFLYAERYGTLLQELEKPPVRDGSENHELNNFREFYQDVLNASLNIYLLQPFLLASLLYIDRFDDTRILEFALWLDYVIGASRFEKQAIYENNVRDVLGGENGRPNLLDVISQSEIPDTVIRTLRELPGIERKYQSFDDSETDNMSYRGSFAQGEYARALRRYYSRYCEISTEDPVANKRTWIEKRLKNEAAPGAVGGHRK